MTNTELLQALYDDMQTVKENVSSLDRRVSSLEKDIAKIPSLEKKINEISLTLENETNRNIKIIAEGHLDLSTFTLKGKLTRCGEAQSGK